MVEVSRQVAGPTEAEAAEAAEAALVEQIKAIHDEFDGTYGEPRVTEELARRGRPVNHKRIERLMRLRGIVADNWRAVNGPTSWPSSEPAQAPSDSSRRRRTAP